MHDHQLIRVVQSFYMSRVNLGSGVDNESIMIDILGISMVFSYKSLGIVQRAVLTGSDLSLMLR